MDLRGSFRNAAFQDLYLQTKQKSMTCIIISATLRGNTMDLGAVFGMHVSKILHRDEAKINDLYFFL